MSQALLHSASLLQPKLAYSLLDQQVAIEQWFQQQWSRVPAPLYSSVDLRNAGFKLAPVDTNLFPAGFNNLPASALPLCAAAMRDWLSQTPQSHNGLLLIPENHTRNPFYFESLARLQQIVQQAGVALKIAAWRPDLVVTERVTLMDGGHLEIHPLEYRDQSLGCADFWPEMVVLNNDLSEGIPDFLTDCRQLILPNPQLGWTKRTKSQHFNQYQRCVTDFAMALNLDPWWFSIDHRTVSDLDFMSRRGEDHLAREVDALLAVIRQKYQQHDIQVEPYVVVKADAGTYGMGVMSVHTGAEIHQLNRKARTRMHVTKGQKISQVIVQEGVHSLTTLGQDAAEPVVYMIGGQMVGGFYRAHASRGATDNLNAPGMYFTPWSPDSNIIDADMYAYSVIARLAALAAGYESVAIANES